MLGAERAASSSPCTNSRRGEHPERGVLRVRVPVDTALEGAQSPTRRPAARFDTIAPRCSRRARAPAAATRRQGARRVECARDSGARPGGRRVEPRVPRARGARARLLLGRLRTEDGPLHRSYVAGQRRERAVLDDYAFLSDALLDLYAPPGIALARRCAFAGRRHARALRDPARGGFHPDTRRHGPAAATEAVRRRRRALGQRGGDARTAASRRRPATPATRTRRAGSWLRRRRCCAHASALAALVGRGSRRPCAERGGRRGHGPCGGVRTPPRAAPDDSRAARTTWDDADAQRRDPERLLVRVAIDPAGT